MAGADLAPARALVYRDVPIRDRGEMLSLTDMWRAAGADPSRQPAEWMRSAQAADFIDHILAILGISQDEAIQRVKGGSDPGTWAHWQIGFAYAKYLSPEFHAWCNEVVRAHMEGRGLPPRQAVHAAVSLTEEQLERFAYRVGEGAAAKCVELMDSRVQAALVPVERRLASLEQSMPSQRKRPSARTAADLFSAAHSLGDRCPCCGVRHVTSPADGTRAIGAEIDHFFRNSHADPAHCWPICRACHDDLTAARMSRTEAERQFHAFQDRRRRLPGRQPHLFG